jgi:hypothetical protein
MKGTESISDTDHNPALEIKEVSVVVPKSLTQAYLLLMFQAWSVDKSLSGHVKYMSYKRTFNE